MRSQSIRLTALIGALALGGTLVACDPIATRFFVVDSTLDQVDTAPGDGVCATAAATCTLRAAVGEGNALHEVTEITLAPSTTYELTLPGVEDANAGGDLDLTTTVTLKGQGSWIDANGIDRSFDLPDPADLLTLYDVTVTGGHSTSGGGAIRGTANIMRTTLSGNLDTGAQVCSHTWLGTFCNGEGGGGAVKGTLTANESTLSGNRADGGPAQCVTGVDILGRPYATCYLYGGGAVSGTATLHNSTLSGNSAFNGAGNAVKGTAELDRVTVVETGPGPAVPASAFATLDGTGTMRGTVLSGPAVRCSGAFSSGGYNTASTTAANCTLTSPTDHVGASFALAPLAANGGPTMTHLPSLGGPVVDEIPPGTPGLCDLGSFADQRGVARPGGTGCDVGAVEGSTGVVGAPLALTVDTAADDPDVATDGRCATAANRCSLRAAVTEANASLVFANTITIAAGIDPVLTGSGGDDSNVSGDLDVRSAVTLVGQGATITGSATDRILHVGADGSSPAVTLRDVTLTGGHAPGSGGGILLDGGALTVDRSTITGNTATDAPSDAHGGGIHQAGGTITITNATIHDNTATGTLGAGGGNLSLRQGAVRYSTITDGHAPFGGGILGTGNFGDGTSLTVTASALSNPGANCAGLVPSGGYNTTQGVGCGFFLSPGDRTTADLQLAPLADNGGFTPTRLPADTSPLLSGVPGGTSGLCDGSFPVTDQRGASRWNGPSCDRGSVETLVTTSLFVNPVVNSAADGRDEVIGDGVCQSYGLPAGNCTLRAAVDEVNALAADTITIAPGVNPMLTIAGLDDTNAAGDLDIQRPVTINGNGATVNAGGLDRAMQPSGPLTLHDLTITGGATTGSGGGSGNGYGGGILHTGGTLTLDDVTLSANSASMAGGGVYSSATIVVTDGRITGNTAGTEGGGIAAASGTVSVTGARIDNNSAGTNGGGMWLALVASSGIVDRSEIDHNQARVVGGGIASDTGNFTTRDSVIQHNTVTSSTGNVRGGGLYVRGGTIEGSTVAFNTAVSTGGTAVGGGVAQTVAVPLLIERSTIDSNTRTWPGSGGNLELRTASIRSTTINAVVNSGVQSNGNIEMFAVALADGCIGTFTSHGYNTSYFHAQSCNALDQLTDAVVTDFKLGPLADNGGHTPTRMPADDSPLVLSPVPGGLPGRCESGDLDQRKVARYAGPGCDRGAVESPSTILAPSLTVNVATDARDATPGDGLCQNVGGPVGTCSLRAAIDETNQWSVGSQITIAPGVNPVITRTGTNEDANATGDFDILGPVVIEGNGSTVDAVQRDRVFDVFASSVGMHDLTITRGYGGNGGGILQSAGVLALEDVTFSANSAAFAAGGGLFSSGGALVVQGGRFTGNAATFSGGGLFANRGDVSIAGTRFDANTAVAGPGGGVRLEGPADADLDGVTIDHNLSGASGGGISSVVIPAYFSLVRSVVDSNQVTSSTADPRGGGLSLEGGGTVEASTIVGNTVSGTSGSPSGGGISSSGPTFELRRSTLHGNSTTGTATARGGNLDAESADVRYTTITGGSAPVAAGIRSSFRIELFGSALDDAGAGCSSGIASLGSNTSTTDPSCALDQPSDSFVSDLQLGPLADNGGPTPTRLPSASSPLVSDAVPGGTPDCQAGDLDQRGVARYAGAGCDRGSVESAWTSTAPSLVVNVATDGHDDLPGDGLCRNVGAPGSCSLRAAVDEANAWSSSTTVTIAPGVSPTLTLPGSDDTNAAGDLDVHRPVTITGNGAVIDANQLDRALHVASTGPVSLSGLTLTRGWVSGNGGGILQAAGTLALTGVTVSGSTAAFGDGGGIWSGPGATLTVTGSRITGNASTFLGGGVALESGTKTVTDTTVDHNTAGWDGGAILNKGTLSLTRSTLDHNAADKGAGIASWVNTTIVNTTVSANTGTSGGAVHCFSGLSCTAITLRLVTVADNTSTDGLGVLRGTIQAKGSIFAGSSPICGANLFTSQGYNAHTDTTCARIASDFTITFTAPLAANGGPTQTHLPPAGHPVIDRIPPGTSNVCDASAVIDQRGSVRPAGGSCDVGAVERHPSDP